MPLTPAILPLQVSSGAVAVVFAVGLLFGGGAAFFGLRFRSDGGDVDPEKVRRLTDGTPVTFDADTDLGEALNDLATEVSETEGSVTVNRAAIESAFDDYEQTLNEFSDGDFTKRVSTDTGIQLVDELGEEINHSLEEVEENIRHVQRLGRDMAADTAAAADSAEEIHGTSEGISGGVDSIRGDVTEQMEALDEAMNELQSVSASVEEVAASADRVASTAAQTAETGSEGREAAQEAMGGLHEIQQSADAAVETIERLDEKMDEISEIAEVIGEIAEQTNMLAINAGIEASRAGEAGEGFGVVADEVKQLADETAERANEIEETLAEIEDESEDAVDQVVATQEQVEAHREAIEDAINSLDEVAELVDRTNEGIQEISQATDDQSEATQVAVERVDRAVSTNEEVIDEVEDISTAAERQTDAISSHLTTLQQRADQLRDTLNMFNVGDDDADEELNDLVDIEDVELPEESSADAEVADDDLRTRTGSGHSTAADARDAGAEAAQSAKSELGVDRVDFAQVFVAPDYDDEAVIDGVYGVVGEDTTLIGATTSGEFTEEGVVDGGVAVGLVASDTIQFHAGIGTGLSESVSAAVDEAIEDFPESVDGYPHQTAINLYDGLSGMGDRVALNTRRKLGPDTSFAGGMAGDNFQLEETRVYCNGRVETDAVVLALLASKNEPFISASHGHEPIGDTYTVTKAEGGVVHELDGRPAFDVWKEEVDGDIDEDVDDFLDSLDDDELASLFAVYATGMAEQQADGTLEYRVRWPGLTDPDSGSLTFATEIEEGAELAVMKSSPQNQLAAASEVGERVRNGIEGDLAGAFVYECACRSIILGDDFDEAVANLDEELDVSFAGFETYGELCQQFGEPSGFHNTTAVVFGLPE